jgi:hypothetical protein
MDVSYYLNGSKIGEVEDVASGTVASLNTGTCQNLSTWYNSSSGQWETRNILNHSMYYGWYVEVSDNAVVTQSTTWHFNTSAESDINENGRVFTIDVSKLINNYGLRLDIGGEIGADINNNARVFTIDVSKLINNYGKRYYTP